ncbi:hypothetical protein [Paenibacillus sp. UNC451MF]|uniref:hypothetical protein n=1 Tax=Paenibacillus sp. UNC451MF TaxID=1449063 RepID=UPI000490A757|nr:hypothetical protein [Paenibacillus sp. UNC451MF]
MPPLEADVPLDMLLDDLLLEDPVLPEEMEVPFEPEELEVLVEPEELDEPELVALEPVVPVLLLGAVVALLSLVVLLVFDDDVKEPDRDDVEGVGAGVAVGVLFAAGGAFLTSVPVFVFGLVLVTGCCPDLPKLPAAAPITAPAKAPVRSPEEMDDSLP